MQLQNDVKQLSPSVERRCKIPKIYVLKSECSHSCVPNEKETNKCNSGIYEELTVLIKSFPTVGVKRMSPV